ncbi:MAG TPA: hypothetical protein VEH49_01580, partial [Methylomirabilota bacterium]|nr:hypothetical protein [Methylomirabilota bacterium]
MTRTEGVRQSDRVQVRVPVEVSWENASGETVAQSVETLLISRSGAVFKLAEKLEGGHLLSLRRSLAQHESKTVRAVVVAEIDRDSDGFLYAVALREPRSDFWDIDFPSPAKAAEALARLLMQCSFCERREVVYLNELELRSFEARRCVARMC